MAAHPKIPRKMPRVCACMCVCVHVSLWHPLCVPVFLCLSVSASISLSVSPPHRDLCQLRICHLSVILNQGQTSLLRGYMRPMRRSQVLIKEASAARKNLSPRRCPRPSSVPLPASESHALVPGMLRGLLKCDSPSFSLKPSNSAIHPSCQLAPVTAHSASVSGHLPMALCQTVGKLKVEPLGRRAVGGLLYAAQTHPGGALLILSCVEELRRGQRG